MQQTGQINLNPRHSEFTLTTSGLLCSRSPYTSDTQYNARQTVGVQQMSYSFLLFPKMMGKAKRQDSVYHTQELQ